MSQQVLSYVIIRMLLIARESWSIVEMTSYFCNSSEDGSALRRYSVNLSKQRYSKRAPRAGLRWCLPKIHQIFKYFIKCLCHTKSYLSRRTWSGHFLSIIFDLASIPPYSHHFFLMLFYSVNNCKFFKHTKWSLKTTLQSVFIKYLKKFSNASGDRLVFVHEHFL